MSSMVAETRGGSERDHFCGRQGGTASQAIVHLDMTSFHLERRVFLESYEKAGGRGRILVSEKRGSILV